MQYFSFSLDIALVLLLLLAVWRDIITRTIPNSIPMIIIAISVASRSTVGWTPFLFSFVAAGALFTVLLVFAIRGWLGGGDVKLAAALATGLPPVATWNFVIITVLAGGLLGFGYLVGPRFTPRLRVAGTSHIFARVLAIEVWRLRRGGPLPYGVAIAAGGVFVLLSTPR